MPLEQALLSLALGFLGGSYGVLVGIGGGLAGLVAPLVIGLLLDITGSFFWGFTIFALANLVAGGCFAVLVSRESQLKAEKAARMALAATRNE